MPNQLSQWCSIRIAVKELYFCENLLRKAKAAYNSANKLVQQRKKELEAVEKKLERYKQKQQSKSAGKREKYDTLVDEFEARWTASNDGVNSASQEAQTLSSNLKQMRLSTSRQEAIAKELIGSFNPTKYVLIMDVSDITSINMMQDQGKEVYFSLARSVTEGDLVSITKAAEKIGIDGLTSFTVTYLDGLNFRILSTEEAATLGYNRLF